MKNTAKISSLLTIIIVCVVFAVKNTFTTVDDGYVSSRERALIKRFDKDGDGQLNKVEQRAADAAMKEYEKERKAYMKKYDANGDGRLSSEEKIAAANAIAVIKADALKKFDKDGDGKLSEEERKAASKGR